MTSLVSITGAFGYSGRHITPLLLSKGFRVRTLTSHPDRPTPFRSQIETAPLLFNHDALVTSLRGSSVLINTYWIRFPYDGLTHQHAVENSRILFHAAAEAGVKRIVHVSITQPSLDSPLSYFLGKAQVEETLRNTGLSYAILRPAVLFGGSRDVLINNIAYLLRRSPFFGLPGSGQARLQPIHVDDLANLICDFVTKENSVTIDAVGPETFSYIDLVRRVRSRVGSRSILVPMPPWMLLAASKVLSSILRDVLLTRDEIEGLMSNLLVSADPATGTTRFTQWLADEGDSLGRTYASEVERHYVRG